MQTLNPLMPIVAMGFSYQSFCVRLCMVVICREYRGGSPTAVQAWQPCPLWELSPSHPILV